MSAVKPQRKLEAGNDVLSRYLHGGSYHAVLAKKKVRASQTPGSKKRADTCRLSPIGGMPRKFFMRSKSYKHPAYVAWVAHCNKVNS